MASTAAIALSSATCTSGQKVTATCTVTNGGSTDLYVYGFQPLVTPNGQTVQSVASAVGVTPLGGAFSITLPGSGTLKLSFDVVPFAPTTTFGNAEPASYVYSVGANITLSDGSIVAATAATLTTSPPSLT